METAEMICRQQQEGNETFCGRSFLLDVLSSDTPSGDRTLGILCVALREKIEGQVRQVSSSGSNGAGRA